MRVMLWHVHGSYTTALVQGPHEYLLPALPYRGPYGRGRAETWEWPTSAVEVTPQQAADADVDVVMLQRPEELDHLAEAWLGGRVPGRDVPAVYLEHNAPQGRIEDMRHPAADRPDLTLVHVTRFNQLFWDAGSTPARVVEHGVVDPGFLYSGDMRPGGRRRQRARPARAGHRHRPPRTPRRARGVAVDLFGMKSEEIGGTDVPQSKLHAEMARRRVYLHPIRWTSLGLTLIEAMHLGMPVVALATTEVPAAVPPEAGVVSNDPTVLAHALRRFVDDPELARVMGKAARAAALERYGLERFLADWDAVLNEVVHA